jgi:hypothetical protein
VQEFSDEWMRSNLVASPRTTASEQAETLALVDKTPRHFDRKVGGYWTQVEVDCFQKRRPHQEVLECHWQVADHFFCEVVVEVTFGAGQRVDEGTNFSWVPVNQRRSDELE